jgi:hypothetical protein
LLDTLLTTLRFYQSVKQESEGWRFVSAPTDDAR